MIRNILVIGGGTAGFIIANMLRGFTDCEITLLKSPKISTIGVGEGTTTFFSAFLNKWCPWLEEKEFIRETNATFKIGSKFENWTYNGSVYTTPSDSLSMPPESQDYWPQTFDLLRTYAVANNLSTNPTIEELLLQESKSPYIKGSSFGHAYHFESELAIKYFEKKSKQIGINIITSTVSDITLDDSGLIKNLILDDNSLITSDFYIDCTGFVRLFAKKLNNTFISWKDSIIVDRAINFPILIKDNEKIPTYTLAKAKKNGWMWRVPTYHRYGSGYIYSSSISSIDEIMEELKELSIENYIQEIKFESGYLEKGWIGNCMFSGLCAGFVEPMEATSLHSSLCNLWVFLKDYFKPTMNLLDRNLQNRYNSLYWTPYWESVRDWIILHYLGKRDDTLFWKSIKEIYIPESLQSLLDLWKTRMPRITESNSNTVWQHSLIFGVTNGLNILDKSVAQKELEYYQMTSDGEELYNMYKQRSLELFKYSIDHRLHLNHIRNN